MGKRKIFSLLMVFVLLASLMAGCAKKGGDTPADNDTPSNTDSEKAYKIVLVLPGPINDQGWNATAYEGLQQVKSELGIEMEYIESVPQADFEATFKDYGEKKYDLVIAHGTQFFDAAKKIGPQYPDTFYMVINGEEGIAPNVGGISIREWEGGYIAGILAGMNTTTKKLGAIGSFPYPVIKGTLDAFEMGAKTIDPAITTQKNYVNSWDDVQKGKETGTAMAEAGADVLFCSANQVGLGSIQAAQAKGIKAVGYVSPQNDVAVGTVVGSVLYNNPKLFIQTVKLLVDGQLKPEATSVGWAEDMLSMDYTDQITDEMKAKVDAAIADLKAGKIEAPKGE